MIQKTGLDGIPVWSLFFRTGFQFFFTATEGADYNSYTAAGGSGSSRIINVDTAGQVNWSYSFKAAGTNTDVLSLKTTADSSYIHVGHHVRPGGTDKNAYIMKMDRQANILWAYSVGGSLDDEFSGVIITADGGYLAVGKTASFGAGSGDGWLIKFSASGSMEWARVVGNATESEQLYSAIEGKNGNYFAVGKQGTASMLVAVKENGYLSCGSYISPDVADVTAASGIVPVSYPMYRYNGYYEEIPREAPWNLIAATECSLEDVALYRLESGQTRHYDCGDIALDLVLKNDGEDTLRDIIVGYKVNNVAMSTDTVRTAIAPGALFRSTFRDKWQPGVAGTYNVCAFIEGAWDDYTRNDTLCREIVVASFEEPVIQMNGTVLTSLYAYDTYQWLKDDNVIPGATGATYTPLLNGNYSLAVSGGVCQDTSNVISVTDLGLDKFGNNSLIQVYPVPFDNTLTIVAGESGSVMLYSIDGKKVTDVVFNGSVQIATEFLKPGCYILKIVQDNGTVVIRKLVKES